MEDLATQKKSRAPATMLIVGLAVGLTLGILAPRFLGDRLPVVSGSDSLVTGIVMAKQQETERLLLTVQSSEGATLATFRERVEEIGLLVDVGDTLTFELRHYSPFIDDPDIAGVKKAGITPPPARVAGEAAEEMGEEELPAPGSFELPRDTSAVSEDSAILN